MLKQIALQRGSCVFTDTQCHRRVFLSKCAPLAFPLGSQTTACTRGGYVGADCWMLDRTRATPTGAVWDTLRQRRCAKGAVPYRCASSGHEHQKKYVSAGFGPAHPAQFICVKALGTEEEPRSSSLLLRANTALGGCQLKQNFCPLLTSSGQLWSLLPQQLLNSVCSSPASAGRKRKTNTKRISASSPALQIEVLLVHSSCRPGWSCGLCPERVRALLGCTRCWLLCLWVLQS